MKELVIKLKDVMFFLVIAAGALAVSFYLHPKSQNLSWKGEIWADRAGYYVYLPAVFHCHLDAGRMPEKITDKTGNGFSIENNKISTKYTYGVSLLLSPFYITTHYFCKILHLEENKGFSAAYHRMADIAAIFYLFLALLMLNLFLKQYFRTSVRYFLLLLILCGTNLFYYTVVDPLMSHGYSFFLFSGFLLFFSRFIRNRKLPDFALMSLFLALIILIRPTNVIIFSVFFFWDIHDRNDFIERIRLILNPVRLLILVALIILIFLPQLAYWKYLHGSWFFYSYGNEGFTNWNQPKFLEVFFSPNNGLLLYSPLAILFLIGIVYMIVKKIRNGIFLLGCFIITSYIIASWYNWYYGCSYGQRSYVEHYALLSVPFGFLLDDLLKKSKIIIRVLILLLILFLAFFNLKVLLQFENCFFGSTWDWNMYGLLLEDAKLLPSSERLKIYDNDMENNVIVWPEKTTMKEKHSGMQSVVVGEKELFACSWYQHLWDFENYYYPSTATVSVWILNKAEVPTGALLVCSVEKDSKAISWQSAGIDDFLTPGKWSEVKTVFPIPAGMDGSVIIRFYLWNRGNKSFFVDDMKIIFDK